MRRLLLLGAAGAALTLAAAGLVQAQSSGAASSAAPAASSAAPAASSAAPAAGGDTSGAMAQATKSGPASVDWPISDLLADAPSHAVLAKDLPALLTYDGLDQIKGMSIRQISQFPQANIDATKLAQIQTDLTAAAAPAAH